MKTNDYKDIEIRTWKGDTIQKKKQKTKEKQKQNKNKKKTYLMQSAGEPEVGMITKYILYFHNIGPYN